MRAAGCAVICYLRDGKLISNPSPDEAFQPGDLVWTAGGEERLGAFLATGLPAEPVAAAEA